MTLRQIAEQSGVSIQTVSRILRGEHKRHNPDTCQRVMAAAEALNYRPNLLGRALQSGKSNTVALMRLGVGERPQAMTLSGISAQAKAAGYHLLVTIENSYRNDQDKDFLQTVDELVGRRVDGLMIHRSVPLLPSTRRYMNSLNIPVVYASWAPPRAVYHVKYDMQVCLKMLLSHLSSLGHDHLAFFPSPGSMDFPGHMILPMQRACMQAGIKLDTVLPASHFEKMTAEEVWGHDSATRYLNSRDASNRRATALVFAGSNSVHGGLVALKAAGVEIPKDVSVVSTTDHSMSELSQPAITALQFDWEAYGRLIFDTLHQAIIQPGKGTSVVVVDPLLVIRASTGPASEHVSSMKGSQGQRRS